MIVYLFWRVLCVILWGRNCLYVINTILMCAIYIWTFLTWTTLSGNLEWRAVMVMVEQLAKDDEDTDPEVLELLVDSFEISIGNNFDCGSFPLGNKGRAMVWNIGRPFLIVLIFSNILIFLNLYSLWSGTWAANPASWLLSIHAPKFPPHPSFSSFRSTCSQSNWKLRSQWHWHLSAILSRRVHGGTWWFLTLSEANCALADFSRWRCLIVTKKAVTTTGANFFN